jgi:hypothetical protein
VDENKQTEGLPAAAFDVRYVGMGELVIYYVSDEQLRAIEAGSPATTMFTLAIALLSIWIGSLVTLLLSAPSPSVYRFDIVIGVLLVSFFGGIILLILWSRYKRDPSDVIKRIRSRASLPMAPVIQVAPESEEETQ